MMDFNGMYGCASSSFSIPFNEALSKKEIQEDLLWVRNLISQAPLDLNSQRTCRLDIARKLLKKGYWNVEDLADPKKIPAFYDVLVAFASIDPSLGTLLGVLLLLGGGSLVKLTTQDQRAKIEANLLKKVSTGELLLSFCMTEMGHGSFIHGLQTLAIYDPSTETFTIDNLNYTYKDGTLVNCSPGLYAQKQHIGNAKNSDACIVFANLVIKKNNGTYESKGTHAFYVPVKNLPVETGEVQFLDQGLKCGLNGIENDLVTFNKVQIPLHYMMMANQVTLSKAGEYKKLVPSVSSSLLSSIIFGRTLILCTSQSFMGILWELGYRLKHKPQQSINIVEMECKLRPKDEELATWASIFFAFQHAKKYLFRAFGSKHVDILATGFKLLSTHFVSVMYPAVRKYLHPSNKASRNLQLIYEDFFACNIYEGENNMLAQAVPGMQVLRLKNASQNWFNDLSLLWDIFLACKSQVSLSLEDSYVGEMRRDCWRLLFNLAGGLAKIGTKPIKSQEKNQLLFQFWQNQVLCIQAVGRLFVALEILKAFPTPRLPIDVSLYTLFRNEIYCTLYQDLIIHQGANQGDANYFKRREALIKEQVELGRCVAPYFDQINNALVGTQQDGTFLKVLAERMLSLESVEMIHVDIETSASWTPLREGLENLNLNEHSNTREKTTEYCIPAKL